MTKTLIYDDEATVPKADADTIRSTGWSWHDPPNDNVFDRFEERPEMTGDGTQQTNDAGDPLVLVRIRALKGGVSDTENWQTAADNFATAINNGLPSSWPTVTPEDIGVD